MNAADKPPQPGEIDYAALAARYLELWQEQVAKLGQDPSAVAAMCCIIARLGVRASASGWRQPPT